MGNVNLPTPVALAGGALCALGGYLLGVVAGPDTVERTTAVVESYDAATNELCLSGDGIEGQEGVVSDGVLCGTWRGTSATTDAPRAGDAFRFVSLSTGPGEQAPEGQPATTVIYGDVVR
ncbi:MAG TPA: hypothetical protein VFV40_03395 [Nocardioides sp.]|nr:hypothetical protein [Nocardioides sp.]